MRRLWQQDRGEAGSAGIGLLAGMVTFGLLFAGYYNGAYWLYHHRYIPTGHLSGQEQIPWAIISLGAPALMLYISYLVGSQIDDHFNAPSFIDGPIAFVLLTIIGGFVAFIVIGVLIVIAMIYIACAFLLVLAIGAVFVGND